ncbi:class I SAM-dependent methyltransferase [uncultured Gimesia sp.]|uniref:class I SAM-dependent methyltransferase n=1 Tax=uncultured Gimesia sp. TaxID=1678688 RepID=UPI0030D720E9|tara:strand:+ start:308837 stop:309628 length:792 start_codon:yes stop_codon:yes gene_type:complete
MKRRHLFEFGDCQWLPSLLRDYMTDYLRFVSTKFNLFGGTLPRLTEILEHTGQTQIVDIASGGGGPWLSLVPELQSKVPDLKITLTDRYPNQAGMNQVAFALPQVVETDLRSIDAREIPADLVGLRTQFLSLHHFEPADVVSILQNAIAVNEPIAVFEAQQRDVEHLIRFGLSPLFVILLTPFVSPFRIRRLVLTYLIPIVPVLVFWDGIVSVLRTYTVEEMLQMAREADPGQRYEWNAEVINSGQIKNPCLTGWPVGPLNQD